MAQRISKPQEATPITTVCRICDCAEPYISNPRTKLFEPGCGDGNFLVEVLSRRLQNISRGYSDAAFQNEILTTVANLYGIDISPLAICETRQRLQLLTKEYASQYVQLDYRFLPLLVQILESNFFVGDLLQDCSKMTFLLWQKKKNFEFVHTAAVLPTRKFV